MNDQAINIVDQVQLCCAKVTVSLPIIKMYHFQFITAYLLHLWTEMWDECKISKTSTFLRVGPAGALSCISHKNVMLYAIH